jgi:site-specific DNA recombinase
MTTTALRRVATYERVSSEDQRERETIKTQSEALAQWLSSDPTLQLVARFIDDGISGTIPMGERPQGRRLLQAAASQEFDELWIYNMKRLGREAVDMLLLRRRFEPLGIRLFSLLEGELTGLGYDVQAIIADHATTVDSSSGSHPMA